MCMCRNVTVQITMLGALPNPNVLTLSARAERLRYITLLQQNPAVLNWWCQLTQVGLCNGHKMVVVDGGSSSGSSSSSGVVVPERTGTPFR